MGVKLIKDFDENRDYEEAVRKLNEIDFDEDNKLSEEDIQFIKKNETPEEVEEKERLIKEIVETGIAREEEKKGYPVEPNQLRNMPLATVKSIKTHIVNKGEFPRFLYADPSHKTQAMANTEKSLSRMERTKEIQEAERKHRTGEDPTDGYKWATDFSKFMENRTGGIFYPDDAESSGDGVLTLSYYDCYTDGVMSPEEITSAIDEWCNLPEHEGLGIKRDNPILGKQKFKEIRRQGVTACSFGLKFLGPDAKGMKFYKESNDVHYMTRGKVEMKTGKAAKKKSDSIPYSKFNDAGFNPLKNSHSNMFEMPNGEVVYVEYLDGKLIGGTATNVGLIPMSEVEYDEDLTVDANLEALYDKLTEEYSWEAEEEREPVYHCYKQTRIEEGASLKDIENDDAYETAYIVVDENGDTIWDTTNYEMVRAYFEDPNNIVHDSKKTCEDSSGHFIIKYDFKDYPSQKEEFFGTREELREYLNELKDNGCENIKVKIIWDEEEEKVEDSKCKDADEWRFKLAKRRNTYDEYVIRAYKNGKYDEEATYYTDDWDDAVGTLTDIAQRQGLKVREEKSGFVADSCGEATKKDEKPCKKDAWKHIPYDVHEYVMETVDENDKLWDFFSQAEDVKYVESVKEIPNEVEGQKIKYRFTTGKNFDINVYSDPYRMYVYILKD